MVVGARFTCMKGRLGQRGNKHIKHTETACFTCLRVWEGCRYVCEGEGTLPSRLNRMQDLNEVHISTYK